MKTTTKKTIRLSIQEVCQAVDLFLDSKGQGTEADMEVKQATRTESVPGMDPHDCDYIEHFDGLIVTLEEEVEVACD